VIFITDRIVYKQPWHNYSPANLFVFDFVDAHGGGTSSCSTTGI